MELTDLLARFEKLRIELYVLGGNAAEMQESYERVGMDYPALAFELLSIRILRAERELKAIVDELLDRFVVQAETASATLLQALLLNREALAPLREEVC